MLLKMTSKRQVTFPKRVVERLHLEAGDSLTVQETQNGILIQPNRFDISKLAPLRDMIPLDLPAPDLKETRHAVLDQQLRS